LDYSRKRLREFLEEVKRLRGMEFPYEHSRQALLEIEGVFRQHLEYHEHLDEKSDPSTVEAACETELTALREYLPFLGLIIRSTNVRNAFEMYRPLLRLTRRIVGHKTKLIISSEWEYSPLVYLGITFLPGFVLVGLPAHQSGNPLLIPLAGHELGHAMWSEKILNSLWELAYRRKVEDHILANIQKNHMARFQDLFPDVQKPQDLTSDFFGQQTWAPASDWAIQQCQELFCDFVGLRIFGESYLYSLAYLLSPHQLGIRPVFYPNILTRINSLIMAAARYGIDAPVGYEKLFKDLDEPNPMERHKTLLLELADGASSNLVGELISEADSLLSTPDIPARQPEAQKRAISAKVDEIYRDFEFVAPAQKAGNLANILNAGWKAYRTAEFWSNVPQIKNQQNPAEFKERVLKELILKSIEVLEFEEITTE